MRNPSHIACDISFLAFVRALSARILDTRISINCQKLLVLPAQYDYFELLQAQRASDVAILIREITRSDVSRFVKSSRIAS